MQPALHGPSMTVPNEIWQPRLHSRSALGLMVASGFAALGYQIVWTQQSALWLGNESAAVLAVITAFFAGLALGAAVLGPWIDRSAHPARWYAGCEAVIGIWSLALALLLPTATTWFLQLIGPQPTATWHWSVAFCGTFLLLLPATAAMGASLPAMECVLGRLRAYGAPIAALYAANTLGAVLGVLACAFWLIPQFGLARTAGVCTVLNLVCAASATRLLCAPHAVAPRTAAPNAHGGLMLLAATGLLGIGYEVLAIRLVSQAAENTVYTFAILLSVYLVGTSMGAVMYERCEAHRVQPEQVRNRLLRLLAFVCLLGSLCLANASAISALVLHLLGVGMRASLTAEAALAVAAFLLPTMVMGALFSHLATVARANGVSFGRALGVNTLGAAAAPVLFGVVLIPALGSRVTLLVVVSCYLALTSRAAWRSRTQWATATAVLASAIWIPSFAVMNTPEGGRILRYAEGVMATVSVVEGADGIARLHINNRQQEGSSATLFADTRQALLPILLHSSPRRALFLGLGTGVTASAATLDPMLYVDAVELSPEVIDAAEYFSPRYFSPGPGDDRHRRLHIMAADARRYVRTTHVNYDVIVSDNFHPARSGSGSLYTVEHFRAVRDRLEVGGVFCQWLPLHQLDLDTLRSIVRSFLEAYPHGLAILATHSLDTPVLGLIGRHGADQFNLAQIRQRLSDAAMAPSRTQFGIDDDLSLLGSFVAGPDALVNFAGNAPLNTDDRPVVAYLAPQITYAPDSLPRDRLVALLEQMEISAKEVLGGADDEVASVRLQAYWKARNEFIKAGHHVQPSADVNRMLAQVREPLLSVLRISPDFRPAYDPLLRMGSALGHTNVSAARELLAELQRLQPSRTEAAQALQDLPTVAP